jgi:hypothetical protein
MKLQVKYQKDLTPVLGNEKVKILITPPVGEEGYWYYRVALSEKQAIIAFPKFGTIGIGFEKEEYDWNTNLPYQCSVEEIFQHIRKNKGDKNISDADCIEAIRMIQSAIVESKKQIESGPVDKNVPRQIGGEKL